MTQRLLLIPIITQVPQLPGPKALHAALTSPSQSTAPALLGLPVVLPPPLYAPICLCLPSVKMCTFNVIFFLCLPHHKVATNGSLSSASNEEQQQETSIWWHTRYKNLKSKWKTGKQPRRVPCDHSVYTLFTATAHRRAQVQQQTRNAAKARLAPRWPMPSTLCKPPCTGSTRPPLLLGERSDSCPAPPTQRLLLAQGTAPRNTLRSDFSITV